ncbi:MAG: CDP-alcohol phosphatidyltransferase [Clostridia bacterium]|nr:CDP-alcohol phosphatidyltransferase [Clostridia bacterium]
MTEEKKKQAKNDFFAYYIGRPISYVLTVPFLKLNIKPNTVSLISFFPSIIGFLLIGFGETMILKVIGWLMFFLWNLLDGVDGNIARYKEVFSKTGSLWDATSGYIAMVLMYYAMGIGCYYGEFCMLNIDKIFMIILGGLSSVLVIFPRLIMHKRITSIGKDENSDEIKDKSSYGIIKIIGLNLISIAGFVQVLMLLAIILHAMDIFTIFYFLLNLAICVVSVKKLLK